jgi:hypothetical protein
MAKFRKKPVVIDAEQLNWKNWTAVCDLIGESVKTMTTASIDAPDAFSDACGETAPYIQMIIPTLEGQHLAKHGDWIVKGIKGEFYPVKPDIFEKSYEQVVGDVVDQFLDIINKIAQDPIQ